MSTYEKILEAAYAHFAEQGYEKAALSQIALDVGISKAALYHHFSSKETLFEALYTHLVDAIISDFETDIENWSIKEYSQKLIEAGFKDLLALQTNPQLGRILNQFYLLSLRVVKLKDQTKRLETETMAYHKRMIDRGVALELIQSEDSNQVAALYTATLNGLTLDLIHSKSIQTELVWTYFIRKLCLTPIT